MCSNTGIDTFPPFPSPQNVVASQVDDNNLLSNVIEMLSLLVKYGYYDDQDDVNDVLRPLLKVVNGLTDLPFPDTDIPRDGKLLPSPPPPHTRSPHSFLLPRKTASQLPDPDQGFP